MAKERMLRERVAAQSAMWSVVTAQAAAPPRTPIARILGLDPLTGASRASYRGALGELRVGDALAALGQRWDVLHDLPLKVGPLDHLVIGPAGVFAVRAANYGKVDVLVDGSALVVGGRLCDDVGRVGDQAAEAGALLGAAGGEQLRVRPLLVVVDPRRLFVKVPAPAVRIVNSAELARMLTKAPRTLTGEEVARLSDLADRASTWPRDGAVAVDTEQLRHDFEAIRDRVQRALGRRVLWLAAAVGLSYGVAWGLIGSLVSLAVQP